MKKRKITFLILLVCFFVFFPRNVQAAERIFTEESDMTETVDFTEIEETLEEILPEEEMEFEDLYEQIISGEMPFGEELLEQIKNLVFQEFTAHRKSVMVVLLLMVLSAVFSNFTAVFKNSQIAELGFYSVYLLLIMVLMKDFLTISESIEETIRNLLEFIRAMVPSYCIAVATVGGVSSATIFYQFILVLILVIQYVLVYFLLPLVNVYVVLIMVNYISKEDFLTKMADLMQKIIQWVLKTLIGLVVGFNVIQGMVAPAMDALKTAVLNKTMSAVPGVGNAAGAVTELLVGSGSLIKNGIGAAGLCVILFICLTPIVKVLIFTFTYRLVGACMQPISDRRLLGGVNGIAEGSLLLFRIVFTAALVLMLSIAILAAATGRIG